MKNCWMVRDLKEMYLIIDYKESLGRGGWTSQTRIKKIFICQKIWSNYINKSKNKCL